MNRAPDPRALAASTLALVVALSCIALFLPPLAAHTLASPVRSAVVGAVLAGALLLHLVCLARGARGLVRWVPAWVSLSVLLFPVGSAMVLILLNWLSDELREPAPQHG